MEHSESQFTHCTELMTGRNLTGFFILRDDHIGAKIYSYEDTFNIKAEDPILLRTEKNEIVSLHSNIGGPPGSSFRLLAPARTCFRQDIISNIAVIGYDAWADEDRVRRVTFNVEHSNQLLHHKEKFDKIGSSKYPDEHSLCVFKDRAGGLSIESRYAASYDMLFDAPKNVWPSFSIEFDEAATIHEYIGPVHDYCRFLCFCLGASLTPTEFHINRLSHAEIVAVLEADSYPGDHTVHYVWPKSVIDSRDLWVGGSPVLAWDDDELAAFRACLVMWMERAFIWRKAYALMETSLKMKNVISSERLVNACRWFEEIPLTATKQAISDVDIDSISATAAQAARLRGISDTLCHRIKGAIKQIKDESREEKFCRLVKTVQSKFGSLCLPDAAVPHLKHAYSLRGKCAHGLYVPEDEINFRAFVKSIAALEALCLLLTAYDLPINDNGIERMRSNPLIRDYLVMTLQS